MGTEILSVTLTGFVSEICSRRNWGDRKQHFGYSEPSPGHFLGSLGMRPDPTVISSSSCVVVTYYEIATLSRSENETGTDCSYETYSVSKILT